MFEPVQKIHKNWPQKCNYDMAILQNFLVTPWDNYREFRVHKKRIVLKMLPCKNQNY